MVNGGFGKTTKFDLLSRLSREFCPVTLCIPAQTHLQDIEEQMTAAGLGYPIIAKPDVGERGRDVVLLNERDDLDEYCKAHTSRFLLQEMVSFPVELGILYCRLPNSKTGCISSMGIKEFRRVRGDGKSQLKDLALRAVGPGPIFDEIRRFNAGAWNSVPPDGLQCELLQVGHRNRGVTFRDARSLITPEIERLFDRITAPLDGFHFGRFDVKTPSLEALSKGILKILEVNGTDSLPIHIFDPAISTLNCYRDLYSHWRRISEISSENRCRGHIPVALNKFISSLK